MNLKSLPTRFLRNTVLALALGTFGVAFTASPVSAAAPMVKTQAPGFYRTMLGDFEITVISDGTVDLPVDKLLSEPAALTDATLKKSFLGSPLEVSDNAFLINTGSRLVLVDTGAGTLFGPTLGKLIANLRAAGYAPEQVDDILLTHMHPDHVGGLVANGQRVFPNAIVHADEHEAAYWLNKANMDKAPARFQGLFPGCHGLGTALHRRREISVVQRQRRNRTWREIDGQPRPHGGPYRLPRREQGPGSTAGR
jgi:glyoxylase-like metal-dependent hydrolase (beta-lactamase superfamily II)